MSEHRTVRLSDRMTPAQQLRRAERCLRRQMHGTHTAALRVAIPHGKAQPAPDLRGKVARLLAHLLAHLTSSLKSSKAPTCLTCLSKCKQTKDGWLECRACGRLAHRVGHT